ncbi:MAG: RsmB/NOP family class I SAM-dependent RNA methyltransferase [Planctomycetes bacterium]|nr:RsmB/NOP family class I SAM-dependent RNA methyltransferase [Planctomycetota bacterium]
MAEHRRSRGGAGPDPGAVPLDLADRLVATLLDRLESDRHAVPSRLLADLFRGERLGPGQQKRIRDRFHAILADSALIDRALQVATPNGVARPLRMAVRVLCGRVLRGELAPADAAHRLGWIDWRRVAALGAEAVAIEDPVERTAMLGSLPPWLSRCICEQFGAEADALVRALRGRAPVVLRTNTLRCSREELAERLRTDDGIETEPTPHASHGLRVVSPARVFATAAWHDGWFEMQDEASQLVAEVTAPPPAGRVLDACAGAGGKTLALAAALGNRGEILAIDSHKGRLTDLRKRLRRAGVHDVRAVRVPEDAWPGEVVAFAQRADRILLDAPCSGLGSLRRNPDLRWRLDEDGWRRLRDTQRELALRAAAWLRPGARLVYATCTVLREENEDIVAAVLAACPELEVVPIAEILGGARARPLSADGSGRFLQTAPHRHGADGFFAAVLRRPRSPLDPFPTGGPPPVGQ